MRARCLILAALLWAVPVHAQTPSGILSSEAGRRIRDVLQATHIDSVRESVIPGLFEIVAGHNVLYADPSARYLVIGHIYDLHTATDLTARRKAEIAARLDRIRWNSWPQGATIVHGRGSLRIAVLSDPQCGWCRKLHKEALSVMKNVRITEILYPRLPGSYDLAVRILCAPDPAAALDQQFSGKQLSKTKQDARCRAHARSALQAALRFGEAQGISGTPTLIAPNGAVHAGFLPVSRLKSWLMKNQEEEQHS